MASGNGVLFLFIIIMMKNRPIITFTTDFGDEFALAQLQAVILSSNPEIQLVTISNKVTPFSILEGSFILSQSYRLFPTGSIHIGVVDHGVGSDRDGIIIKTDNHWFIWLNNGLLYPAVLDKNFEIFNINENIVNPNCAITFHGRDIFARTAALLSISESVDNFAAAIKKSDLVKLEYKPNHILHIDDYGNYKINNDCSGYQIGDQICISINSRQIQASFVRTFADGKPGEIIAYKGSHDLLEVAQNLGSASNLLQFPVSEILSVQKC